MEHTLAGFHDARERVSMASRKEAKVLMAEMHSNGSLAVLAQIHLVERSAEISVVVQERNGCMRKAGSACCTSLGAFPCSARARHRRKEE